MTGEQLNMLKQFLIFYQWLEFRILLFNQTRY